MNVFRRQADGSARGFSLIEVNLAILLVATGLLVLFSLFPLGLRESEMGVEETHEAMFADSVLSTMEGNALAMTNWAQWSSLAAFRTAVVFETDPPVSHGPGNTAVGQGVRFPSADADARFIRYRLTIGGSGIRKSARLEVVSGKYGDFNANAKTYFTEFVYTGM